MVASTSPSSIAAPLPLRCRCGAVRGTARDVSRATGSRIVCYCADCQAFVHFLGQGAVLDSSGGTDIFQMAPSSITLSEGSAKLQCIRLSEKGMFRFYATCCKTPVGNMVSPGVPFIGLIDAFMDFAAAGRSRDEVLGAPRWRIHGAAATGPLPPGTSRGIAVGMIPRTVTLLLAWSLGGKKAGMPFFDRAAKRNEADAANKAAGAPVRVLTPAERDALRTVGRG